MNFCSPNALLVGDQRHCTAQVTHPNSTPKHPQICRSLLVCLKSSLQYFKISASTSRCSKKKKKGTRWTEIVAWDATIRCRHSAIISPFLPGTCNPGQNDYQMLLSGTAECEIKQCRQSILPATRSLLGSDVIIFDHCLKIMEEQKNWVFSVESVKHAVHIHNYHSNLSSVLLVLAVLHQQLSPFICINAHHHTHTTYFKLHMYDGTRNCTSNYVVYWAYML